MVYCTHHYVINWDKVQTLDDMKRLMKAIDFSFEPNHSDIEKIKDLVELKEKEKIGFLTTSDIELD